MVENSREQRKNNRSRVFVLAVILGLALSGYALWHIYWRTMASILPGVRDISSTSMEPIELTLFTRYKNNRPIDVDAPPLAWVLKMPRAFLKFEIGNPDAVHMAGPNCCDHFINLEAVYDPESRNLLPATIASPELRRQSAVGISLANRSQLLEIISGDHCIKEDDFKSFMQQRGNNIDWRRNCDPKAFRCRVYTHLDGWSADFSVPRKFYAESDLFCRVVRDFLKASTIRRDDLR